MDCSVLSGWIFCKCLTARLLARCHVTLSQPRKENRKHQPHCELTQYCSRYDCKRMKHSTIVARAPRGCSVEAGVRVDHQLEAVELASLAFEDGLAEDGHLGGEVEEVGEEEEEVQVGDRLDEGLAARAPIA